MLPANLQPDQQPHRWDDHVSVYETVFEPFTLQFARPAIAALGLAPGQSVLDVGAGSGGAAMAMAAQGLRVAAIDASVQMVDRVRTRAAERGISIAAEVMDGQTLRFGDSTFDAALSVLGVILFPNAERGLVEMRRVVRSGGRVAVVTWTQPQNYELAAELRRAIQSVWPDQPQAALPAQLRYREAADFRTLFKAAGLAEPDLMTVTARLDAPSARWLSQNIAFAPGMAALMTDLGPRRPAVLERFAENLEARSGNGRITLSGVAFIGTAQVL
jgi:ubiquinone/menaquinone biosynthesis C-methylase UbiE